MKLRTIPIVLLALGAPLGFAQEYRLPPEPIRAIADAPPTPDVRVGPDGAWLVLLERPALRALADLARPELRLAGLRIDPRTNGPSRTTPYARIVAKAVAGAERPIEGLNDGARLGAVSFSPDGRTIAFTSTTEAGLELWVAPLATGRASRLVGPRLNAAAGMPYVWLPDSSGLLARLVPEGRPAPPVGPEVPAGPIVQENLGRKAPARTYQDLLRNAHDEALLAHYLAAAVARVSLDGTIAALGAPGLVLRAEPSPDGAWILVETLERPFSYRVPLARFPRRLEIWSAGGAALRLVARIPLQEEVPIAFGAVPTGPRSVAWRDDHPAALAWAEAIDGGDPAVPAELRDRVRILEAPFDGEPRDLLSVGYRIAGVQWGGPDLALVTESWAKTRRTRTWIVHPSAPVPPRLLWDRSSEDRYGDPGRPVTRPTPQGTRVLALAGSTILLAGSGSSPEGDRPFLDRLDLATGESKRLWRSEPPVFERPVEVLDPSGRRVLVTRESIAEPANYFVRDIETGALEPVTAFPHPYPGLQGATKELLTYRRADGLPLSATLHLPPGWKKGDAPLPVLVWAYPQEFKTAEAAGQVSDSPHRFARIGPGSPLYWLAHGYAVLDDPKMPILGEGDVEPNDTYVDQLVASAQAAVDEIVRLGIADRDRIAIGGHSYGAFMTANLLARADLFRAGVARSGAYNRTLTPFGFQGEDRTLWAARETYVEMSPFLLADRIDEPLLLVHGEADDNSGTFPMQSERFFAALAGHGATVRLVVLPHEGHGYQARESVMHVLWETTEWLDRYVKNAGPRPKAE